MDIHQTIYEETSSEIINQDPFEEGWMLLIKPDDGVADQARFLDSNSYLERVKKQTEYAAIHRYPILATPGLVINEKLVCAGRIPGVAEVTTWLANAEMEAA
jgi:hypothetical protein